MKFSSVLTSIILKPFATRSVENSHRFLISQYYPYLGFCKTSQKMAKKYPTVLLRVLLGFGWRKEWGRERLSRTNKKVKSDKPRKRDSE